MIRLLAYLWASPNTVLGLLFVLPTLLSGGGVQCVRGVLEIHGGFTTWFLARGFPRLNRYCGPAAALTLGHIVLGQNRELLESCRDHEHVHVRQYERWGILFLPAYYLSSMRALRRGAHPDFDNRFEQEAFAHEPGCSTMAD